MVQLPRGRVGVTVYALRTTSSLPCVPPLAAESGKSAGNVSIEAQQHLYLNDCLQSLIEAVEQCLDAGRELPRYRGTEFDGIFALVGIASEQTPEDAMAAASQRVRKNLEVELLEQVKTSSPAFFERLVVDLVVAMGYGGSRQDAGRAVGRSGDGGIDGIIKEDRLGLDVIYLQAKRWENTVGRPDIQKFAGALQGQRASKGIFITTSNYSRDALEYVNVIATKIILIDGDMLTALMVDYNIAVTRTGTYELKKIDSDYFEGE
jgi:HJR/Mrr/RecB family endonuclease